MALLGTATVGVVNIIDSHLLSKRLPSLQSFLLPIGTIILIISLVLFYLFPLPEGVSTATLAVAVAGSMARAGGVLIMFYALRRDEVSRVIPVIYTYPIFVAIMAMFLLGESLTQLKWLAIVIVVAGAILISVRPGISSSIKWPAKTTLLLFGASLLFAASDVASKFVLADISAWNLLWINMFLLSAVLLIPSIRPATLNQWRKLKQKKIVIAFLTSESTLAMVGIGLMLMAIERGPVSLVSAIAGSRPAFVVVFALILSRTLPDFLNWEPGKGMLALRFIATAMIVGGIIIMNLL